MFSSKNLPIMPALCSKLAYYAGIMLDALACLLCLKLCRHNRRMPSIHTRGCHPLHPHYTKKHNLRHISAPTIQKNSISYITVLPHMRILAHTRMGYPVRV